LTPDLILKIKRGILNEYTNRYTKYFEEVYKFENSNDDWSLNYLIVKEGLAVTLKQVGLFAQSFVSYYELKKNSERCKILFFFIFYIFLIFNFLVKFKIFFD
jgi:hypothetical protein